MPAANEIPIPTELIEHLNHGDCILFAGDNLDGSGAQSARLAAALAAACGGYCEHCLPAGRCQFPEACDLWRAAQLYEKRRNRGELVAFARQRLAPNSPPTALHLALAALPVRVMITTAYDHRLETALHQQGRSVFPICA